MSDYWPDIALIAALILLNAFFAASEIAVISARDARIRQLAEEGNSAAAVLERLMGDPSRFLATIQVGITLAGFLASASAAVSLARPLAGWLESLGLGPGAAGTVAVGAVTLVISYVTLVLGELAPKRLAMQKPEPIALVVARPIDWLARLAAPFTALLARSTNLVVRAFGGRVDVEDRGLTEEEIRFYVAEHEELRAEEKQLIEGVFDFGDRLVRQVMVPRPEMKGLRKDMPLREAVERVRQTMHENYPVYDGDPDRIVGVVNVRDLLQAALESGDGRTVESVMRPARFVPETKHALDLLKEMKREHFRLAIVVDEYGGVSGLVTLDDLLEEIVGHVGEVPRVTEPVAGSEWLLDADTPIEDVNERLDVEIPASPHYETLAGFVLYMLGRIPEPGEGFEHRGWRFEVEGREGLRVTKVRLRPPQPAAGRERPSAPGGAAGGVPE